MKRAVSLILAMMMALSVLPTALAAEGGTYHSGQEPPYSLQYFQDIEGLTYLDCEEYWESMASSNEYLLTDITEEVYDATWILSERSMADVVYRLHNTLKKNGLTEGTFTNAAGSVDSFYYTDEDWQGGRHQFTIVPHEDEKKIVIEHEYVIDPMLTIAEEFERFTKSASYTDGQFTDVKSSDWFVSGVKLAYELGLMNGDSATKFNPSGNMTVAETITIAARLNSIYMTGAAEFEQDSVWYMPYVNYAIEREIISAGQYSDYNKAITRGEFARIMHAALPMEAWTPINYVYTIPDVDLTTELGANIYDLYEAGVLTGNDKYGTFNQNNYIQRSEAATMLTRMAIPTERKKVQLLTYPADITMAEEATLLVGDSRDIWVSLTPGGNNDDNTIKWNSTDPTIVSVNASGRLTAKKPGVVTITATTVNGKQVSCKVSAFAQKDMDEMYARITLSKLINRLKFPDTLQLYNIWAISYPKNDGKYSMCITIYYSAESAVGIRSRGEYIVYYDMDSSSYLEETRDSSSTHTYEREININNITR